MNIGVEEKQNESQMPRLNKTNVELSGLNKTSVEAEKRMSRLNKRNIEFEKRGPFVETTNKLNFDRKNAPYLSTTD